MSGPINRLATRYHTIKDFRTLIKTNRYPLRPGLALAEAARRIEIPEAELPAFGITKNGIEVDDLMKQMGAANKPYLQLRKPFKVKITHGFSAKVEEVTWWDGVYRVGRYDYAQAIFRAILARLAPLEMVARDILGITALEHGSLLKPESIDHVAEWVGGTAESSLIKGMMTMVIAYRTLIFAEITEILSGDIPVFDSASYTEDQYVKFTIAVANKIEMSPAERSLFLAGAFQKLAADKAEEKNSGDFDIKAILAGKMPLPDIAELFAKEQTAPPLAIRFHGLENCATYLF